MPPVRVKVLTPLQRDKVKFKIKDYAAAACSIAKERAALRKQEADMRRYDAALARLKHETALEKEYELHRSRRGKTKLVSKRFAREAGGFAKRRATRLAAAAVDGHNYRKINKFLKRLTA